MDTSPSDPGLQVAVDEGKQVALPGMQWIGNNGELEVASQENLNRQNTQANHVRAQSASVRRRIMLGAMIGLILIILGAVLGGVLGSRHKNSVTESSTSPLNSSAPSPSKSSAPSPSVTPTQRNIAAVSFSSNSANTSRVYFQDNEGQIIEASSFEPNMTWSISKIGMGGKNGSAIAAAVSIPSLPLEISLFYLDVNNTIHDITYTGSTNAWTSGTISAQNYTTMPNASLAAMYHWCSICANTTIIAFQDENGFVQIGNFTSGGWILNQLGQGLEPLMGTGLALQRHALQAQINLWYQISSGLNISTVSWNIEHQDVNGWSLKIGAYSLIPSGSPIAAASSYSDELSNGLQTWTEVLSLSATGIEVATWSGRKSDWLALDGHPSAMANSTKTKTFESIAVTANGDAFAVVKHDGQADAIESWQLEDDIIDWSSTGSVDLHGAWG